MCHMGTPLLSDWLTDTWNEMLIDFDDTDDDPFLTDDYSQLTDSDDDECCFPKRIDEQPPENISERVDWISHTLHFCSPFCEDSYQNQIN